jgi:hypothetical protein
VTLVEAYVNSFTPENLKVRHDVLLRVSPYDQGFIEGLQTLMVPSELNVTMREPHVTHGTYPSLEQAEQQATALNQYLLPCTVEIVGVTVK